MQFAFFGAFFFVSLIYYLISLAVGDPINRIGYKTSIIVALLVCGALVPLAMGLAADSIGIQYAFAVPIVCYVYIAFYGFVGHEVKPEQLA